MKAFFDYLKRIGIHESRTDADPQTEPPAVYYNMNKYTLMFFDYNADAPATYFMILRQKEKMFLKYATRAGLRATREIYPEGIYYTITA